MLINRNPQCIADCKTAYSQCLRTAGNDANAKRTCEDEYNNCEANCPEVPGGDEGGKEVVLACNKVPGAPGEGMCVMMPKENATDEKIALCNGKKEGDFCGGDIKKKYLWCKQNVCEAIDLTDQEALNYAESIKRCEGLKAGDKCGGGEYDLACQNGKCFRVQKGQGDSACAGKAEGEDCQPGKTLACIDGACKYVEASTPELIAACNGKKEGDTCGKGEPCKNDDECPSGWKCLSKASNQPCAGTCDDGYCSEYTQPECEKDEDCGEGYQCINGKCMKKGYCSTDQDCIDRNGQGWVCKDNACVYQGTDVDQTFKWSEQIQNLLNLLAGKVPGLLDYQSKDVLGKLSPILGKVQERMNYLFDYPRGLTPEERQAVSNYYIESMKRAKPGRIQSLVDRISRAGLTGGGYEQEMIGREERGTRQEISDFRRSMAVDELNRRFNELMQTTGMATQMAQIPIGLEQWDAERMFREMLSTTGMGADITKMLMGGETTVEQLSSGRRAETLAALQTMLQFLGGTGGEGQQNVMLQTLLQRWLSGGQGGGQSWLPWFWAIISQQMS